jgi:hypothetical protein
MKLEGLEGHRDLCSHRSLSEAKVVEFAWVVERLTALLEPVAGIGDKKRQMDDVALKAISDALNETLIYSGRIDQGGPEDREIEEKLARVWGAAAVPLRHIDPELAEKCQYKAEYWANPRHWDQKKVNQLGIALKDVANSYRDLLKK